MNLELEQRRTEFQERSAQLENQSRCAMWSANAMVASVAAKLAQTCCALCREIAELKTLLEVQTGLNATLQRELEQGQALISQVVPLSSLAHAAWQSQEKLCCCM